MDVTADLFGLAIAGYLFLYFFNYTRLYISQRSNYETLFLSIISGYFLQIIVKILGLISFMELESIRTAFDPEKVIRLDLMAVAILLVITLNICLRPWHLSIKKWIDKDNLIVVRLQEKLVRLQDLQEKPKPGPLVEIYTSSNSKYTGFVLNAPPMNRSRSGDVELLAVYRGWIDGNTGNETTSADYFSLAYSEEQKRAEKEFTEKLLKAAEGRNPLQEFDQIRKEYKQRMEQTDDKVISELPQIVVPLVEIVAVKNAAP